MQNIHTYNANKPLRGTMHDSHALIHTHPTLPVSYMNIASVHK